MTTIPIRPPALAPDPAHAAFARWRSRVDPSPTGLLPCGWEAFAAGWDMALADGPAANGPSMRRFRLNRLQDDSGISGTGVVAEGVVFSNGRVGLAWLTAWATVSFYPSVEAVEAVHGHAGRTVMEWLDAP